MSAADVDGTLAALADPTRRRVVELLRDRPRRAGELASDLGVTPAALSRHLRVLRERGLVLDESVAGDHRIRVYRLRPEPLGELHEWLASFWRDQLDALRAHVATTRRGRRGES